MENNKQGLADGSVGLDDYNNSLKTVTAGTRLAAGATKIFKAAITSLAVGALMFAITKGIELINNAIHAEERAIEAGKEAAAGISEINKGYKSQADTVNEAGESYAKLAQGIDQLTGKNRSLSTDGYKEFLNLSNSIADVFPHLVKGYDENGNAILRLNGDAETITDTFNELLKVERELANQKILEHLPDVFNGAKNEANRLQREIDYREKQLAGYDRFSSLSELVLAYKNAKSEMENEITIGIVTENFNKVKGLISSVSGALGEFGASGGITLETFQGLIAVSDEYADCLEYNSGRIVRNKII